MALTSIRVAEWMGGVIKLVTDTLPEELEVLGTKIGFGDDGQFITVKSANPLPVAVQNTTTVATTRGTHGHAAGTAPATVDVPANARTRFVWLLAGATQATIAIAGGTAVSVPANAVFQRELAGDVALGSDVVIAGGVASYYVEWITP